MAPIYIALILLAGNSTSVAGVVVLLHWTNVIFKGKKGNEKAFEITVKKMNENSEYQYVFVTGKGLKGLRISW